LLIYQSFREFLNRKENIDFLKIEWRVTNQNYGKMRSKLSTVEALSGGINQIRIDSSEKGKESLYRNLKRMPISETMRYVEKLLR